MRLYNPNFGKETESQIKSRKCREIIASALVWLAILAAIAGLVCCIIFKVKWYFYLVDIGGCIVLLIIFSQIFPSTIKEYVDIPVEESEDEYVEQELSKITPENVLTNVSYRGIWKGIAVCECNNVFDLKDITFDVENVSRIRTADANSNQNFYEKATVTVKCHCPKCGMVTERSFHDVTLPTGAITNKRAWLSESTTITTTSYDADYSGYVEKTYNNDLALHKSDCKKYETIIMKKAKQLRQGFRFKRQSTLRKIEKLKENGWYEKPSEDGGSEQISDLPKS